MSENNNIRSVQRALKILKCFDSKSKELSLTDISKQTELSKSTVIRILNTLVNENFLIKNEDTIKYRLGYSSYLLGLNAKNSIGIKEISEPYLAKMTNVTKETANLYLLENYNRICVSQIISPNPINHKVRIGDKYPIWSGATGRSILAFLDESIWHEMLKEIRPLTPNTIINSDDFIADLKFIVKNGYCLSKGEKIDDVECIASPVFDSTGIIGCISISGPVHRFPNEDNEKLERYIKVVKDSALEISSVLGYKN